MAGKKKKKKSLNIINKNHKNSIHDSQSFLFFTSWQLLVASSPFQLLFTITLSQAEAQVATILLIVICHAVA